MKRYTILLTIASLVFGMFGAWVDACLQPAGRNRVGEEIQVEGVSAAEFVKSLTLHEDGAYWEKVRADLERQRKNAYGLYNPNNLAVALIHLGQVKEAIPLLQKAEKESPGQYATAANLGTAYELAGENQKALEWIKESINRDRDSHYGTEWLHVKILEAKLAIGKDTEWLKKHSVLGINFGERGANPPLESLPMDHFGQRKSLPEVEAALIYQLHERLEFIKPPEPIVADLLSDLSRAFSLSGKAEHARAVQELAVSYGADSKEIIKEQQAEEKADTKHNPVNSNIFYWLLGTVVVLIIGSLFFVWRKRKPH